MTIAAPTLPDARPTCADPKWLEVVDAAFKRPGGPAGRLMIEVACPTCPVRDECLAFALEGGEHGLWGGTGPNVRTRRRGRLLSPTHNLRNVEHVGRTVGEAPAFSARDVKAWARSVGIPVPARGRPKAEVYQAYACARLGEAS